jgi:alpha-glucosidase
MSEHLFSDDPKWWRQAAIYQIYPRSFKDSDGDGLGDIRGITSEVPYLASLNLDAVWLSPFYPSALADGGYDVADYRNVDPRLGTLEDFDEMVTALHDAGIRVFVDIVPNHSSNLHAWFQEALVSEPGSPARERYIFRDGQGENGELPPSDWPSHFAPSAWTRTTNPDGTPGQWYLHLFAPEQPDFNWDNPGVHEDFLTTLRFWSDRGVDGFRIDVAHALKKDLREPFASKPVFVDFDNPLTGDDVLFDRNDVHEVYRKWRKVFDEYTPPRVAVAEAWVRAERRVLYARPDELGQAFNFDLLLADFDAAEFKRIITENIALAKTEGSSSTWVLSNHDRVRHTTRYGLPAGYDLREWLLSNGTKLDVDTDRGLAKARAATLLMLALPGSSYLYQGEELGLFEVADIPFSQVQDPIWERNHHTDKGRDGCRVPLPWSAQGKSFGFSSGSAHLPQPASFAQYSVDVQSGQSGSTLELYRAALKLRRELQSTEDYEWIATGSADVLHFARTNGWQSVTNFGSNPVHIPTGAVVLASAALDGALLPPYSTVWLKG